MLTLVLVLLIVNSTLGSVSTKADVSINKETLEQKYPDLVHWFERAAGRVRGNVTASPQDLTDVRNVLQHGKQKIHDFVTSPFYDLIGGIVIEQAVSFVTPLLGVIPLEELREFMKIMSKKPELAKIVLTDPDEEDSIVKILPNAALFEHWFANSTIKMVDDLVASTSTLAEESVADFDILQVAKTAKHDANGAPGLPGADTPSAPARPSH